MRPGLYRVTAPQDQRTITLVSRDQRQQPVHEPQPGVGRASS